MPHDRIDKFRAQRSYISTRICIVPALLLLVLLITPAAGITVVAIRKGERYIFNPLEEERLERGHALIVAGGRQNQKNQIICG